MNSLSRFLLCASLFAAPAVLPAAESAAPVPPAKIAGPLKTDKFKRSAAEDSAGYRSAVRVGNTLYLSGATAGGAMPDAIRKAYGNLGKILAHYGLGFEHVVKENLFTTKLDEMKAHTAVRKEFFTTEYPAATWVEVSRLWDPSHVLEVEMIAVFPE